MYLCTCIKGVELRKAFKHIGELQALVDVPFMVLTASAPPPVQLHITQTLHLRSPTIVSVSQPSVLTVCQYILCGDFNSKP